MAINDLDNPRIDPSSDAWRAVRGWAEHRLAEKRASLEAPYQGVEYTENLRGAISELKALISLPQKQQQRDKEG